MQKAYSGTLSATGGTAPYVWSVTAGSLPSGLTLNASTGVISGTPTAAGSSSFSVQARDSGATPATGTAALAITVSQSTLQITTSSLTGGQVKASYSAALAASGGTAPYSWSVASGSLPAGLTLNASTGAISGTPTAAGASSFSAQAKDSEATPQTVSRTLSISVVAASGSSSVPTLQITTSGLASGQIQVSYAAVMAATGGTAPYIWSVASGSLPAGLTLNGSTGAISGTPTAIGSSSFSIQAQDSETTPQVSSAALSINIAAPTLQITTSILVGGQMKSSYGATLAAGGGVAPYTWSLASGSLPSGLALNAATGAISGTPTASGSSSFSVQAKDSEATPQTANRTLSISIAAASNSSNVTPLQISTGSLPSGQAKASYVAALAVTGGTAPYTWSVASGSLPAGLALNGTTGAIAGTPTSAGTSSFSVQAKDSEATPQTATQALSIAIAAAQSSQTAVPLQITTSSLAGGQVKVPYNATVAATGGTAPYTWSVASGSLPVGLTLSATGAISGTPTATGSSSFSVQVKDSAATAQTATQAFSITVAAAQRSQTVVPLQITTSSLTGGQALVAYNATLTATGGTAPYSWSLASGSLLSGLTLNASTGAITGTPLIASVLSFSVQVTDSSATPQTATAPLSINITAAAAISVTVSPTSVSIATGSTQQFSATVSNSTASATWSTTDPSGKVSSTGLYTAGTTAGNYSITAAVGSASASANVTVTVPAPSNGGGGSGTVIFQDTFASPTDNNWHQNTPRAVTFDAACSGADYSSCAQISVKSGDDGDNLLSLCAVGAGDCTSSLNVPTHFFTYYKMQVGSGADFGGGYAKFTYFKNGSSPCPSCNVCYYEFQQTSAGPAISLHTFCDSPDETNVPYTSISLGTSWHTLETEYSQGQYFNVWWDNTLISSFPSGGSIPSDAMNWIEAGLYSNNAVASSYSILLNNFEVCTGGRCPGGPSNSSTPASAAPQVTPASATVAAAGTQQFSANASVSWSVNGVVGGNATVGTITSSGLYTAPAAVPSTSVTVVGTETSNSAPSAPATVTIMSNGTTQQTALFGPESWASGTWSAWGGGTPSGISLSTTNVTNGATHSAYVQHVAGTGSTTWAETYFGDLNNAGPQQTNVDEEFDSYFDPSAEINVSNGGGTKLTILISNQDWTSIYAQPLAYSPFYLTLYADPKFNVWGEIHRKTVTPDVWQELPQNMGTNSPLALGKWQHIKVHAQLNTPGNNDGVLEMWINGAQTMEYTNVDFRDSYTMRGWNQFEITGFDNAPSSNTWNQYWDNINIYVP